MHITTFKFKKKLDFFCMHKCIQISNRTNDNIFLTTSVFIFFFITDHDNSAGNMWNNMLLYVMLSIDKNAPEKIQKIYILNKTRKLWYFVNGVYLFRKCIVIRSGQLESINYRHGVLWVHCVFFVLCLVLSHSVYTTPSKQPTE